MGEQLANQSTMALKRTAEDDEEYVPCKVIAEIGCNHMGSMETAKELIDIAKRTGADYAKFQKRCPKELLTEEQYNAPHPVPANAYGPTYGAHREFLELSLEHKELFEYCKEVGVGYATSVWDITSAKEIVQIPCDLIKVGSPSNQHWEMMKVLRDDYDGMLHVSTGMTTKDDIEEIIKFFEQRPGCAKERLVLYCCTSGYPVNFEDVCMLELKRLKKLYSHRIHQLAFSGHHLGIAIDIAAYTLGAQWVERHFTKDRTWKGTDHAASLEPAGLEKLCRDLKATYKVMSYKNTDILDVEQVQRKKLKFGQYNKADIEKAVQEGKLAKK